MSLIITPPASILSKAVSAFSSELVKTPAWSPNSESLILRMASPKEATGAIVTSGANASFEQTKLAGSAFSMIVRLEGRALGTAAGQDAGARGDGLVDPGPRAQHGLLVDHRPEVGRAIERIADLDCLDGGDELLAKLLVDLVDDEDALDRDADLPGVGEGADLDAVDREVEIGVAVDDDPGVAAELEHDLLHAGTPLHFPADVGRAGEGEELEARILDQSVAHLAVHRHDADSALRARRPPR